MPGTLEDGRVLRTTAVHQEMALDMPVEVVDQVPDGVVAVPLPYLALPPDRLWALIDLGRSRPDVRRHFGTPSSLEWHVNGPPSPIT